jgi:two-component system response regulator CpxR
MVVGLELGADDYVAKPCSARVLAARLRALLRRHSGEAILIPMPLRVGDLALDPARRRVAVGDLPVELTGAEFNLLALLVRDAGRVVSRETLAEEGLGRGLGAFDRRLETHITQIRRKLGPLPDGSPRIQTVRGAGYQYVAR